MFKLLSKEEIQELGVKSSVDAKRLEQDTATQEFKSSQIHQEKDLVQQKNLQTLSNQLDETIKENKRTTLNYRKKKHKIEKEVENWISKYDVEMQEKEREIQALNVSVLFWQQWLTCADIDLYSLNTKPSERNSQN